MDHYRDFKILNDPDFPPSMLMNALFTKLHRLLVKLESIQIGISFPSVKQDKPFLGNILRLHGTLDALNELKKENWLKGMRDHLQISECKAVPTDAKYCRVRRVQVKSNAERLRRRYLKRHEGVTESDILSMIPNTVEKRLSFPFIQMKSESTGQAFRLFIEHLPAQETAVAGVFNRYGLSQEGTIPWF